MIIVDKNEAATNKEQLVESSLSHITDVSRAINLFCGMLRNAATRHDFDKLAYSDAFYRDFSTGFKTTDWWDSHRKISRHHIDKCDGVRDDINLIDVLEHIADCVMAGMARSGSVYDLKLSDEILQKAFKNTYELLKANVKVNDAKRAEAANT